MTQRGLREYFPRPDEGARGLTLLRAAGGRLGGYREHLGQSKAGRS